MPLLYYWRRHNYQRDLDLGAGYHLNQDNSVRHDVETGDSLWAFTRAGDGRYVLAPQLFTLVAKPIRISVIRLQR